MTQNNKELIKGMIPGLILPLIFIFAFIRVRYEGADSFWWVVKELFRIKSLSAVLAIGSLPNLIVLFYAMNRQRWQLGRGVIAATMLYALVVMIIKFV